MAAQLFYLPFDPVFTSRGIPAGAAKASFFYTGTTDLAPIYSDADLTTRLPNPAPADGLGQLGKIYLDDTITYRLRITDSNGQQIGDDADPYVPGKERLGPPGPADNTYTSLVAFKASDIDRKTATLVGVPGVADGRFNWETANAPYVADDANIIKADSTALTVGAWVRQQAGGVAYGRSNIALPLDKSLPRTLAWLSGVDALTTASQHNKLVDALAIASAEGYAVEAPALATIRKDGPLNFNGVSFDGKGMTFMPLSDGDQGLILYGNNWTVKNLRTLGAARTRTSSVFGAGITIGILGVVSPRDWLLQDVIVDTVGPDTDGTKRGVSAAGIGISNAFHGRIVRPRIVSTLADGINIAGGSQDLWIDSPLVEDSGDDSFATNSYRSDNALVARVWLTNGLSVNSRSRGGAIVGGRDVFMQYEAIGSAAAAGYIASEASFDTYGVDNCHIQMTARGCVTGADHLGPDFQNNVAIIAGRAGTDTVDGGVLDRVARNCTIKGHFDGAGVRCSGAIDMISQYIDRCTIGLTGGGLVGTTLMPVGVGLGGRDTTASLKMDTLGNIPLILSPTASGRHRVHIDVRASNTQSSPNNTCLFLQPAPALDSLAVSGTFDNSPTTFVQTNGFDGNKLTWRDVVQNGVAIPGRDYTTATPSFLNGWTSSSTEPVTAVRYGSGQVVLSGRADAGTTTANTAIATLPAGYRPSVPQILSGVSNNTTGPLIRIDTDGTVTVLGATGPDLRFNNYNFWGA